MCTQALRSRNPAGHFYSSFQVSSSYPSSRRHARCNADTETADAFGNDALTAACVGGYAGVAELLYRARLAPDSELRFAHAVRRQDGLQWLCSGVVKHRCPDQLARAQDNNYIPALIADQVRAWPGSYGWTV